MTRLQGSTSPEAAESGSGGFVALDRTWRYTFVSDGAAALLGKSAEGLLGRTAWGSVGIESAGFRPRLEDAARTQTATRFIAYSTGLAGYLSVRACPLPEGMAVFFESTDDGDPSDGPERTAELVQALRVERALRRFAVSLASDPTTLALQRSACDVALEITEGTVVWLSRFEGASARVLARSGQIPQLLPDSGELHPILAGSEADRARQTGSLVTVDDAARDPSSPLGALGLRSGTWAPITLGHGSWGVLCAASLTPQVGAAPYAPALIELAKLVGLGLARVMPGGAGLSVTRASDAAGSVPPSAAPDRDDGDLWQRTFDSLTGHVAILGASGEIVAVNEAWTRFAQDNAPARMRSRLGVASNYLRVCDEAAKRGERCAQEVADGLRELLRGDRELLEAEYPCHHGTEERWFQMRATTFTERDGRFAIVQHENVTAHHRADRLVHRQAHLLNEIDAAVICTDLEGVVTLWNGAAERLYGWPTAEAVGRHLPDLASGPADQQMVQEMPRTLLECGRWEAEKEVQDRHGRRFLCYMRNSLVYEDDVPVGVIGISVDVTERRQHERNLESSRNYLRAVTSSITDGLLALNSSAVVVYGNTAAADMLGWQAADLVGQTLDTVLGRVGDQIAETLGGNEVVRRDEDRFVRTDGRDFPVTWTASKLEAGPDGDGHVLVFRDITPDLRDRERRLFDADRIHWSRVIEAALATDRFELHAQPIVHLASGVPTQYELLLRLRDIDGTLLPPGQFLPAAEAHQLMGLIDRWVINHGIRLAASGMRLQLNLSAQSISDPGLLDELEAILIRQPIPAGSITLELTETAIMADQPAATAFTTRARALGFRLALDDFGTGYNGFANLKWLAVDQLKIDMQFVRDLLESPASENVVKAVISLAASFEIGTVAEGVEDADTLERLRELGVDHAQGYHLGRPAPLP